MSSTATTTTTTAAANTQMVQLPLEINHEFEENTVEPGIICMHNGIRYADFNYILIPITKTKFCTKNVVEYVYHFGDYSLGAFIMKHDEKIIPGLHFNINMDEYTLDLHCIAKSPSGMPYSICITYKYHSAAHFRIATVLLKYKRTVFNMMYDCPETRLVDYTIDTATRWHNETMIEHIIKNDVVYRRTQSTPTSYVEVINKDREVTVKQYKHDRLYCITTDNKIIYQLKTDDYGHMLVETETEPGKITISDYMFQRVADDGTSGSTTTINKVLVRKAVNGTCVFPEPEHEPKHEIVMHKFSTYFKLFYMIDGECVISLTTMDNNIIIRSWLKKSERVRYTYDSNWATRVYEEYASGQVRRVQYTYKPNGVNKQVVFDKLQ